MGATTTTTIDVAIVGGGPAGAATALALARAGYTVTVLERSRYDAFRIGETLPPAVKRPLMELGVWDQFLATGPLESPGIVSAWGRPDPYDNDFIVNPDGPGWHVDRRGFDAMLARAAGGWGVKIETGVTAIASVCRHSAVWHLEAVVRGVPVALHARILVDATGRSASPARQLAGHRIVFDRLVGLVGVIPACKASRCPDHRTLVEAVETGWWYTALLPDGRRIAAFMTDGDLVPSSACARARFRDRQLERAKHTRACLGQDAFDTEPRIAAACSSRPARAAGPGWLAVGDAAAAFDPLSQQGVAWALDSALEAARAIDAHLSGDLRALDRYADWVESEFTSYLQIRDEYYAQELRWPGSPFWRRRNGRHGTPSRNLRG